MQLDALGATLSSMPKLTAVTFVLWDHHSPVYTTEYREKWTAALQARFKSFAAVSHVESRSGFPDRFLSS